MFQGATGKGRLGFLSWREQIVDVGVNDGGSLDADTDPLKGTGEGWRKLIHAG